MQTLNPRAGGCTNYQESQGEGLAFSLFSLPLFPVPPGVKLAISHHSKDHYYN